MVTVNLRGSVLIRTLPFYSVHERRPNSRRRQFTATIALITPVSGFNQLGNRSGT